MFQSIKPVVLSMCILLGAAAGVYAGAPRPDSLEQAVNQDVGRFVEALNLDEEQQQALHQMFSDAYARMQRMAQRGGEGDVGLRADLARMQRQLTERIVPLLTPEQIELYVRHESREPREFGEAIIGAARKVLGLPEEQWAATEPKLHEAMALKAELFGTTHILRGQLRSLVELNENDAEAIAAKVDEIKAAREDTEQKLEAIYVDIRKSITPGQWAVLVLEGVVE